MKIRCKFVVRTGTQEYNINGPSINSRFVLEAIQDKSIPENEAFTEFTPQGRLEVTVNSPGAVNLLKKGGEFYLDLSPVE